PRVRRATLGVALVFLGSGDARLADGDPRVRETRPLPVRGARRPPLGPIVYVRTDRLRFTGQTPARERLAARAARCGPRRRSARRRLGAQRRTPNGLATVRA